MVIQERGSSQWVHFYQPFLRVQIAFLQWLLLWFSSFYSLKFKSLQLMISFLYSWGSQSRDSWRWFNLEFCMWAMKICVWVLLFENIAMWKLLLCWNKCKREYSSSNTNDSNIILPCNHLSIVSVPVVKVISYLFLTNPFSD